MLCSNRYSQANSQMGHGSGERGRRGKRRRLERSFRTVASANGGSKGHRGHGSRGTCLDERTTKGGTKRVTVLYWLATISASVNKGVASSPTASSQVMQCGRGKGSNVSPSAGLRLTTLTGYSRDTSQTLFNRTTRHNFYRSRNMAGDGNRRGMRRRGGATTVFYNRVQRAPSITGTRKYTNDEGRGAGLAKGNTPFKVL